ncbi:LpxA family transferase (plasmid) [Variovorax paradoxus]|nr:LpxA family transferase [Variovorax paradoxus]
MPSLQDYVRRITSCPLRAWANRPPWELTTRSETVVSELIMETANDDFDVIDNVLIHRTAIVERNAVLKGPLVIGPRSFIASGAYLRGGCWLDEDCVIGPGCEVKSSFIFASSKLAHFNFVGDSILGERVNVEAGALICNYRNERPQAGIRVRIGANLVTVDANKFGALVGDYSRLGANSVVAPGALLSHGTLLGRTELLDQEHA